MTYIHLVNFALREGVEAKTFFSALEKLCTSLGRQGISILALQTATHDGSEIPNDNLHYFRMVFASAKDFNDYLTHPEHKIFADKAVAEWINPESIKIANAPAAFRQSADKPGAPVNKPRSHSF